jgi:hypothetical protein
VVAPPVVVAPCVVVVAPWVVVVVVCVVVVVVCDAPPAGFAGAFAAGFGAAGAGFFVSMAALARLAAPSRPARINAAEPFLMAFGRNCMVIVSSFLFQASAPSLDARALYSTSLTFPLVKVTFMSL